MDIIFPLFPFNFSMDFPLPFMGSINIYNYEGRMILFVHLHSLF